MAIANEKVMGVRIFATPYQGSKALVDKDGKVLAFWPKEGEKWKELQLAKKQEEE